MEVRYFKQASKKPTDTNKVISYSETRVYRGQSSCMSMAGRGLSELRPRVKISQCFVR